MKISAALGRIAPSRTNAITDRAFELRAAGKDVISLSVGEPDFATPAHVIAAAKAALDAGDTKYTAVSGTQALREAAALHFARDLGITVPPGRVIVSAGGKQAIFHALLATLDPGDEVLVPSPWWVSYPEIVRFAGAQVVDLPTNAAGGFRITAAQLDAAITPRTRWLLLNSPGNPTGATYPAEELRALGAVLVRHPQVLVMSDDNYAPLRYTPGAHATLAGAARSQLGDDDALQRAHMGGVAEEARLAHTQRLGQRVELLARRRRAGARAGGRADHGQVAADVGDAERAQAIADARRQHPARRAQTGVARDQLGDLPERASRDVGRLRHASIRSPRRHRRRARAWRAPPGRAACCAA